ncbi:MAG: hypothetical protein NTW19_12265 [Planctomycetota bacterium]|nr:hypothetical protein [Planctomycetota bacterium]
MYAKSTTPGQRVFTCAHSFHEFVPGILDEIAAAAGIAGHATVGLSSIGGSRVVQHWDVPDDQNEAKRLLRAGGVDVLTLSPIWLPDAGMEKFAALAAEHNPNVRVTLQEYWLPNDEYEPAYPLNTGKQVDHDAATGAGLRRHHEAYFRDFDGVARGINKAIGREVVFIAPVGQAVIPLREMIIRGEAPGLKTQAELFTDSWGHVTQPIQVLAAYCHFAVIYRRSPTGLPAPSMLANAGRPGWDRLNRVLQDLAWEAAKGHALSGVG